MDPFVSQVRRRRRRRCFSSSSRFWILAVVVIAVVVSSPSSWSDEQQELFRGTRTTKKNFSLFSHAFCFPVGNGGGGGRRIERSSSSWSWSSWSFRRPAPVVGNTFQRRLLLLSTSNHQQDSEEEEEDEENLTVSEKRSLTREFIRIGGPALVQLAAEPLAALVDTAYLGRLGPEVLGGAGVAVSAQYAVSKLYNDPLLRTSISLVASRQKTRTAASSTDENNDDADADADAAAQEKELSVAVSSALLLAGMVGFVQLVIYSVFCRGITSGMGVPSTSPMWHSAISYLQIRALGTPAATLWLVANGIFRGLGDTRTPLVYSLGFTALNAVLDPLFIFVFGWGASGAAAGTALAQYTALIPLLLALNQRAKINILGNMKELKQTLKQYMEAGGLVLLRTFGKVLAYGVCARHAALLGSIAAAAYNLTFQLGFATTQICEAVAVAVQTLLAREMASASRTTTTSTTTTKQQQQQQQQRKKAQTIRHLITTAVLSGGFIATVLSLATYFRRDLIVAGLTTNPAVQTAALSIFPIVLVTQVLKGLAYPVNGIIMGGLDWYFSMIVMWISNLACVGYIRYALSVSKHAAAPGVSLKQLWTALAIFMGTQVVAGVIRYESKLGVWAVLKGGGGKADSTAEKRAPQ